MICSHWRAHTAWILVESLNKHASNMKLTYRRSTVFTSTEAGTAYSLYFRWLNSALGLPNPQRNSYYLPRYG